MGSRAELQVRHSRDCAEKAYSWGNDIVVASMDTAKRDPHQEILLNEEYDMLIIDEAHKLKNKKTSNYQFIQKLRKNTASC